MEYWVQWVYAHAPAFIRSAVEWLVKFTMGVVGVVTGALLGNRNAWLRLYHAWQQFRTGLAKFATAVPATLAWLRNVWVPRIARLFVDALGRHVDFLVNLLNLAFRAADALIDRAWRAATSLLSRALSTLERWAREAVNAIWRAIPDPIRRAWLLLLDPRRLAEWAAGAIWFALARLANREVERIIRWILAQSVRFTVAFGRMIEGVIVRVL